MHMVGAVEKEVISRDQLFSSGAQRTVSFPLLAKGRKWVCRRIAPGPFQRKLAGRSLQRLESEECAGAVIIAYARPQGRLEDGATSPRKGREEVRKCSRAHLARASS